MKSYDEIKTVPYAPSGKDPFSFRWYNADEVIAGKPMSEHLRFAMSWWHTINASGTDMFGGDTMNKTFGLTGMDCCRAKADFAFGLMQKLGVKYYCFHDVDIAPVGDTLEQSAENLAQMTDYLLEKQKESGIKLLWGTSNMFSDKVFMAGAATSCCADVFALAAGKVKSALDATIKLGGSGYVFWGGREGYDTLLNTDMGLELDNLARLLTMARDYGRAKGFAGDFYIEPKPKEPTKHQYDTDVAACLAFLRKYGLTADFRTNIEANHATLAGHTFQHELRYARINGAFGSIDANQGDLMLGWDTDQFPTDVYATTMCMYEVLMAGGFTNGGLNFDAKTRRASNTLEDILLAYIAGMDSFALGLRNAVKLIEDGRIDGFVKDRYESWRGGVGERIISGEESLESLYDYIKSRPAPEVPSGRQEYLETLLNGIMFGD